LQNPVEVDAIRSAAEHGRICGLAGQCQRDLQKVVERYPTLCPNPPFDPALASTVAMAMAFSAPWCTAGQLRVGNRAVLWGFAADWQIDYLAKTQSAVDALVAGCLAVADGGSPLADNPLGQLLAEIRDELATVTGFETVHGLWREELARMLAGMAREWEWKSAQRWPTFDEYLGNADNLGASWVNLSHWIATGDPATRVHLAELIAAGREEQRVLRLVNDLATYERDLKWADLNALMLADRDEVGRQLAVIVDQCTKQLRPLEGSCPREVAYLMRQIGFTSGFYQVTDFWGSL
jgi:hypothetical protein